MNDRLGGGLCKGKMFLLFFCISGFACVRNLFKKKSKLKFVQRTRFARIYGETRNLMFGYSIKTASPWLDYL